MLKMLLIHVDDSSDHLHVCNNITSGKLLQNYLYNCLKVIEFLIDKNPHKEHSMLGFPVHLRLKVPEVDLFSNYVTNE
jgi:hypothetical protein